MATSGSAVPVKVIGQPEANRGVGDWDGLSLAFIPESLEAFSCELCGFCFVIKIYLSQ